MTDERPQSDDRQDLPNASQTEENDLFSSGDDSYFDEPTAGQKDKVESTASSFDGFDSITSPDSEESDEKSKPTPPQVDAENKPEPDAPIGFLESDRDPLDEDDLFGSGTTETAEADGDADGDDSLFDNIPTPGEDGSIPVRTIDEGEDPLPFPDGNGEATDEDPSAESDIPTPPRRKETKKLSEDDLRARQEDGYRTVRASRIRFCFAVLFTLMLTVLEAFDVFGVDVTVPLGISRVPGSHALLDLQLILLICFCARYSLWGGIVAVFRRRFRAETVLFLSACAVAWFDIDAYVRNNVGAIPSALPLAVSLCALVYIELLEGEVQVRTLSLLLSKGVKYAAINTESPDGDMLVLSPVRYVDGFDEEIGSVREDNGYQFTIFLLSAGVTAGAILSAVLGNYGWNLAASIGMSAFFLTVPFVSLLARRIRFAYLSASFLDGGTAVIGEDAAFRYADVSTFSVEDGDAFSVEDTKIKIVNVFRDSQLDTVLKYLNGIYRVLGGPLSGVLSAVCGETGLPASTKVTEVVSGGVTAEVDGVPVHVGSAEYVARKGYMLPESDVDNVLKNDRMCVLFCCYQGEVRARFYIEYALSRAFESRAERLQKLGVKTEVRTFDPNLTRAYFGKITYLPEKSVSIRRMEVTDIDEPETRRADSALFAVGSLDTMLDALHTFRRYVSWRHFLSLLKVLQFLLGASLSAILLVRYPGTPIPVSFSALYSMILFLISFVRSAKAGRRVSERMRSARGKEIEK